MKKSLFGSRSFALVMVLVGWLTGYAIAQRDNKEAARDKALREADQKAFAANMAEFSLHVEPFLKQHCVSCHNAKKLEGDLALELLDPDMKDSSSGARWAVVREKLTTGEMPPDDSPTPGDQDIEKVLAWIKAEMKRSRRNFTRRVQYVHGNSVPHEMLFGHVADADLDVPPRIRRYSPDIYENFRKEQAKGFENLVGNPFTPDPHFSFRDMGAPQMDVPTTSQLLRNALTIVERQTGHTIEKGELKPMPGARKEFLAFVDPNKPLDNEQMVKAITMQFQRTLGRSPNADELQRFESLMERNVKEAGRVAGVRYTLAAVFMLPDSIFRYEVGGPPNDQGKTRLEPDEIAFALAFTLTDQRPQPWLIDAGNKGELNDAAGVATIVERMLNDEKLEKTRILRFFHEFFEYPKAIEVFKDPDDFKQHKARVLVSDTDNLIRWILRRDKDVLRELLTTDMAFVNARYDNKKMTVEKYEANSQVHLSYSLPPDWKWTPEQPIKMPAGKRAGVLTQPSWLVAWSMNQDNHAILRGKWVRQRLLGNVVPDIPITVDAQLPEAPEKTLRERMAVTREEYCWQCHKLMNSVGLPFETFDHFGRWRALELGKPVDASGRIDLTGDSSTDTDVADAIDFVHKLASSERVEQVFVRHAFRYFTGRNENLGDGPSLRLIQSAYRENSGSFNSLLITLLSSESFLYRTPNQDDVAQSIE